MTNRQESQACTWWRRSAAALAVALLGTWVGLGYLVFDGAMSLDYCRAEQAHLKHDLLVVAEAAKGRADVAAFVDAAAKIDRGLNREVDAAGQLRLESTALQFTKSGVLEGIVPNRR